MCYAKCKKPDSKAIQHMIPFIGHARKAKLWKKKLTSDCLGLGRNVGVGEATILFFKKEKSQEVSCLLLNYTPKKKGFHTPYWMKCQRHLWPVLMRLHRLQNIFISQDSECILMLCGRRASKMETTSLDIRGLKMFLGLRFSLFFDGTRYLMAKSLSLGNCW